MRRYGFWIGLGALWLAAGPARAAAPPNVVLIVADYLGYADVGPYGATDVRTPALDRLAAEGARLTEFYAAAPTCSPSRAALLSGRYPARAGVPVNVVADDPQSAGLSPQVETLPRWLRDAGYATAHVGKWHLGKGGMGPNAHGCDRFFGFHTWTIGYHDHRTPQGQPGLYADEERVERSGYVTDLFTEEARPLEVLAGRQHGNALRSRDRRWGAPRPLPRSPRDRAAPPRGAPRVGRGPALSPGALTTERAQ